MSESKPSGYVGHVDFDGMQKQIETAQDMLQAVCNQRNAAQNECVQLAAQIQAASRKITELEAKIKELETQKVPLDANDLPPIRDWSNGNGHDTEAIQ